MLAKSYNYLLKIEYDGSSFVGWQYQKNGISVQEKIEKALSKIFNSQIRINGSIFFRQISDNLLLNFLITKKSDTFIQKINLYEEEYFR